MSRTIAALLFTVSMALAGARSRHAALVLLLAMSACTTGEVAMTSAPVPTAPPPGKPTPTPDPAIWRFEGRVVDPDGKPLRDVCVVIGPHGCQRGSPRTDERGVYFIDLPQVPTVVYDLYFVGDGYTVVWHRVQPAEPMVFNVVLRKPQSRMDRSDG